jgi:hypothetical protein
MVSEPDFNSVLLFNLSKTPIDSPSVQLLILECLQEPPLDENERKVVERQTLRWTGDKNG